MKVYIINAGEGELRVAATPEKAEEIRQIMQTKLEFSGSMFRRAYTREVEVEE